MQNSIALTVYCLTPETLHTSRGEETTHMNSRIIITAGLGVPLSTVPSTILFDVWFFLYYFELIYNQCPDNVFSSMYIYALLCVLTVLHKINQSINQ